MNVCLTTPQHKKQIGYWVSEKGKCMKWLYYLLEDGLQRFIFGLTELRVLDLEPLAQHLDGSHQEVKRVEAFPRLRQDLLRYGHAALRIIQSRLNVGSVIKMFSHTIRTVTVYKKPKKTRGNIRCFLKC